MGEITFSSAGGGQPAVSPKPRQEIPGATGGGHMRRNEEQKDEQKNEGEDDIDDQ